MRRVVLDPGVLVSAIVAPTGPPAEIVRLIRQRRLALVVSPHLLAELLGVLRRPRFRAYVNVDEAEAYVGGLASLAETLPDAQSPRRVTRDPKDDYLIALAVAAGADALISGDADILAVTRADARVLSPRALLDELTRGRQE